MCGASQSHPCSGHLSDAEDRPPCRCVLVIAPDLPLPWTFHERWSRERLSKQSSEAVLVSGSACLFPDSYKSMLISHHPFPFLLLSRSLSFPGLLPPSSQINIVTGLESEGCVCTCFFISHEQSLFSFGVFQPICCLQGAEMSDKQQI